MINVIYRSSFRDPSGYGSAARDYIKALSKHKDLDIKIGIKKFWVGQPLLLEKEEDDLLNHLENKDFEDANKPYILIHHLTPENFYIDPLAGYHICYTPFETDRAPYNWRLNLRAMDEIWVPSQFNKEAYLRSGVYSSKISVIPHGVDMNKFNPEVLPLKYYREAFNFGANFDWTERKGGDKLIEAYLAEFKQNEKVSLTLKSFWKFPFDQSKSKLKSFIRGVASTLKKSVYNSNIFIWPDILPPDLMPNFYTSLDCFVLPTRGEGWGLPFSEAMGSGVLTIGPNWGGSKEFMNSNNSLLVDGCTISSHDKYAPLYNDHMWFDCDINKLRETMRKAYEDKEVRDRLTKQALIDMREKFTWERAAGMMADRIREVAKERGME